MGVALDNRQIEYCWQKKFQFNWNVPLPEGMGYAHQVILFYELQTESRATLAEWQQKITLTTTVDPLTVDNILSLMTSDATKSKIDDAIVATKLARAGYEYITSD